MPDNTAVKAALVFDLAARLDASGLDNFAVLGVLGVLVRLHLGRVPAAAHDHELGNWAEVYLHQPCPFGGNISGQHDDAA